MERTIKIELPDDFRMLCEIFNYDPQSVIQEFIDRISLPEYYYDPHDPHRWATLFFLDYMDHFAAEQEHPGEVHDKFIRKLNKKIKSAKSARKTKEACREVLEEWHKAIKEANSLASNR